MGDDRKPTRAGIAGRLAGVAERMSRAMGSLWFRLRLTILGVAVTALVIVLDAQGLLGRMERRVYDLRVLAFGGDGGPTTRFVHLDIDDGSIEAVGRWAWPRWKVAAILDELRAHSPKLVALDFLYSEETQEQTDRGPATSATIRDGAPNPEDARLGRAMRDYGGRILVAMSASLEGEDDPVAAAVRDALKSKPSATTREVAEAAARVLPRSLRGEVEGVVGHRFTELRRQALMLRILDSTLKDRDRCRAEILGDPDPLFDYNTPLGRVFEEQFSKAKALKALWSLFPYRPEDGLGRSLLRARHELPPIGVVAESAGGYGFVDYLPDGDGVLRRVPMLVYHRHLQQEAKVSPQLALALACADLGIDPRDPEQFTVSEDRITLVSKAGKTIVIPMHTDRATDGRSIGTSLLIPWSGGRDWREMYGPKGSAGAIEHVPVSVVWQLVMWKRFLSSNQSRGLETVNGLRSRAELPRVDGSADYDKHVVETLREMEFFIGEARDVVRAAGDPASRETDTYKRATGLLRQVEFLERLGQENVKLRGDIRRASETLAAQVRDKAVIVGWTATASASDAVPTSLHAKCPGVAVHGLIYNAIMTGGLWTQSPAWVGGLFTAVLGLAATWIMVQSAPRQIGAGGRRNWLSRRLPSTKFSPLTATVLGVTAIVLWVLFNGYVLFGRFKYVVDLSPGLAAMLGVWACGIVAVAAERARIMQLLGGYVDPQLVGYLMRRPVEDLFRTRRQEVTVCFSDIKGFTTLTQQLGARMVPLLQEYLSAMVGVIREHGGVVSKFMGDGIMFIFGVPEPTPDHAERAMRCVLAMQKALARFNDRKAREGYPELVMRCGINSGDGFVGDAGPKEAREYTSLGDTTNVAARLETANKMLGTRVLVSEACKQRVAGNLFVFIPVGRIELRNRAGSVMAYELLCLAVEGTDVQREVGEALEGVVRAFCMRSFAGCIELIDRIEARFNGDGARFGAAQLCGIYRDVCRRHLAEPPGERFEGQVISQD